MSADRCPCVNRGTARMAGPCRENITRAVGVQNRPTITGKNTVKKNERKMMNLGLVF